MTTATPSNSSSSSAQGGGQPESALPEAFLLLKRDVFTAYLQPLLKKHEMGTLIQYEDLTSSWQAAIATLGRASTDSSSSTTTTTTQKEHVSTVVSIYNLPWKAKENANDSWTFFSPKNVNRDFVYITHRMIVIAFILVVVLCAYTFLERAIDGLASRSSARLSGGWKDCAHGMGRHIPITILRRYNEQR
jgi:hypothetical protein